MGENSKIEWTDHTFNPWRGCTKVSPGCAHCYAETLSKRNPKTLGEWGPGKPRVLASDKMWKEPLKWNAEANSFMECPSCKQRAHGADGCPTDGTELVPVRPRVFCASLADWLDDEVPVEWLARLFTLIHQTPNLDWLLLTKRPENWSVRVGDLLAASGEHDKDDEWPWHEAAAWAEDWLLERRVPENVWMGESVENAAASVRVRELLSIPAKMRFLSCEPLLGPVDLEAMRLYPGDRSFLYWPLTGAHVRDGMNKPVVRQGAPRIHWVIAGGESGPGARPMHPKWARSLRDQCEVAGVPFLFKQWGNWALFEDWYPDHELPVDEIPGKLVKLDGVWMVRMDKHTAGRFLDGEEYNGFPLMEGGAA